MSVSIHVEVSGDLEHPKARALAEHACRLVVDAVARIAADIPGASVTMGEVAEEKDEVRRRRFAGFERWEDQPPTFTRRVFVDCRLELPPAAPPSP